MTADEEPARTADAVRWTALGLAAAAAACAVWTGWSWYGAAHDDGPRYSRLRDEVLRSGEQAVQNLNTLDYRHLDQSLRVWQDSTTSGLYQEIMQGRTAFEQQVQAARSVSTAKVLEGAVTELDDRAGKAGIIVALQITVVPPTGQPVVKQNRLIGHLTRTSSGWKLSDLGLAPVGTSAS